MRRLSSVSDAIEHMGVARMPNVRLTEPMEAYVRDQIESGAYANSSEVVRAGIGDPAADGAGRGTTVLQAGGGLGRGHARGGDRRLRRFRP